MVFYAISCFASGVLLQKNFHNFIVVTVAYMYLYLYTSH